MHIVHRIHDIILCQRRSVTWFAAQICCTLTHAYKIFARQSIDTELLRRIGHVLGHDFFRDLSYDATHSVAKQHTRTLSNRTRARREGLPKRTYHCRGG